MVCNFDCKELVGSIYTRKVSRKLLELMALEKVVDQNKTSATFFDTFGLTFWGLQARVQQSLESARVARATLGLEITPKIGLNTKDMK